ncbi:hypothetical protein [Nocardia paucivorans]|uniref:hypothetical protein n=1 Tax=Nocardia paucivorans TaxID=114259 RepID=UPI0002E7E4C0|nr:hypothetical protein [Nocardia paucivorans]
MTALKAVTAASPARTTSRRRMVTVAALAAGAVLALSGCGAGQISQTASQAAAVNGNSANIGEISLRNVHIVYPPSEGYTNARGGKAVLALSFVNNSATVSDELAGITTDIGTVQITPPKGGKLQIAPQETVVAAPKKSTAAEDARSAGEHDTARPETHPVDTALIEITGLTRDISPGLTYSMSFNFKQNGTVQVQVPVDAGTELSRQG